MSIQNVRGIQNSALEKLASQSAGKAVGGSNEQGDDFGQMLMDALKEVNESQQNARQVGNDFMAGRQSVDYHDLMIAMERASIAMNLTVSVRNKLLEAYQEINRIQV